MRPLTLKIVFASLLLVLTLSGCGFLSDRGEDPTATPVLPPTYTPTQQATKALPTAMLVVTPEPPTATALAQVQATPVPATSTPEPLASKRPEATATAIEVAPTLTPTAEIVPSLIVSSDSINVRSGPGTAYAKVGVAAQGDGFRVTAKNEGGSWWQVCCFDGQPGWLFGDLVDLQHVDAVTVSEAIPTPPQPAATPAPVATAPPPSNLVPGQPNVDNSTTAGSLDAGAQYQIVRYHVRGIEDNNGGIFNKGGQHHIFLTVLDENGNGLDGAVVKDAVGDKLNVVTGSKGSGMAEITMDWDPYKLYVSADHTGLVTSQVSNQMNTAHPH
ncbi:MAG: SH3 domain-containing protein, partial [Halieaceae bacterium]|nr:SH3 domain-containing protein [Halieaceae bacterium]